MTVKAEFTAELRVSAGLMNALGGNGIKKVVDKMYYALGRKLIGRGAGLGRGAGGQFQAGSIIGRHFTPSNKRRYNLAPLSPAYAAWKRRQVGRKPILVFSGRWRKSALAATIRRRSPGVELKPRMQPPYAKFLEHGTPNMPARPAFTVNDEDVRELSTFAEEYINDQFGQEAKAWVGDLVSAV